MSLSRNNLLIIALLGFFFISGQSFAQREIYSDSIPFKDRLYFGGNLGLQFGTVTLVDVSPLVGVMITPRLSGGVGATFQYYDDSRYQGAEGTSYGGRLFSRFNVLPNVFLHAEYESINWETYDYFVEDFRRTWSNALFLGAGYFAPFGSRGGANFTFLYNVLHDNQNSYYAEPYVIRIGFVM
ncbi:hypothetical protein [Algoriphagus sp. A40]|uniref:hypothetical protein n=1 Tax=Algoriphagus sp. A40 TaxID=1945863 RepID=UPI000986E78B|nr:hypothetical protein [Algoriphagus sp. A40]OOG78410.1 hypothetical protein B0E43_01745 [Algoriphagus sp. A40]